MYGGKMMDVEKNKGKELSGRKMSGYLQSPWLYVVGLALLSVIVFSGFFFSDKMLYSSDQMAGLDAKVFMKTSILDHHQFPFWFNSRLGGMPTIDALFGDAFYIPAQIINMVFPVDRSIGLKMILHIFLAGLFFFLMLYRGFGASLPIAFVGGILYMFNPEFFSHIYPGHDGKMYVIALVPFMVWRLKALVDIPTLLNATFLGLGIGMALLTSQVQITYFTLWGLFAYAVFAVVLQLREKEIRRGVHIGAFFSVAVLIGLGIGLIQLYPSFMYVRDAFSVRGVDRGFEYAASWSLHWPEFFSLWIPEFGNTLENYWGGNPFKLNSEYAGGIVLVLAVFALIRKPKPWRFLWAGIALFAVLYSLGAHTPVFKAAYYLIPGVKKFRACSMIMFWYSFGVILLGLLFLKDMLKGDLSGFSETIRKKWSKGILIGLTVCGAVALLFSLKGFVSALPFLASLDTQKQQVFDTNFSRNFVPMLWLWFLFIAATMLSIWGVVNGKLKPHYALAIIGILCTIDILRDDAQFIKYIDSRPYFYDEPAIQKLKSEMSDAPFRVFSLPGALPQNGEGIHGLEGISGFHDNELRWYREFRGDQDRNYFDQMLGFTADGGAYLKADRIDQGNPFLNCANARFLLARNGNELMAIENKNAFGRVSFAPRYIVLDSSQVIAKMLNQSYDYKTTVAFFKEPTMKPASIQADTLASETLPFSAKWKRYTPNERTVTVVAPQDGFLRISEVFYPGWKVTVDQKPAEVLRADLAWMAVYVPKGEHKVTLRAQSLYFSKAAWITFPLILMLCIYWSVVAIFRKRKEVPAG
jgi:hypothetical protein